MNETSTTGCCPRFDPAPWQDREITWTDKPFVRDRVRTLFNIPLNFGGVMKRNITVIEAAGASDHEQLVLTAHETPWRAEVWFAVTGDVPGVRTERLSGTFRARAFEGPYSQVGKWTKEMAASLEAEGRPAQKIYYWYTTCPKCAKAYGKNPVVLLAAQAPR